MPPIHSYSSKSRARAVVWRATAFLLLCILAMFAHVSFAAVKPVQPQDVERLVPEIEAYVAKAMKAWKAPGVAVGIVAGDKLVYAKGFGVKQVGSNEPVDADTLFQIGSTTKAFLGATEALLVDQGKLKWTDKVIDHYPQFQMSDAWVTREFQIADLLAQRSGLPFMALTNMMIYDYSQDDIIKALRYMQPVSSFRSQFAYQNAFHLVAGKIVAQEGGTASWEAYLQAALLDPLGMTSTGYTIENLQQSGNWARGHRSDLKSVVADALGPFPYNADGAGNLNSNVKDLSRWLRFQINQGEIDGKRLISAEVLAQTHEPRIKADGVFVTGSSLGGEGRTTSYATGWAITATPQGRIIEHSGGTVGYNAQLAFDPDRRFGVIVLVNMVTESGQGVATPLGKYIVDLLQGSDGVADYAQQGLDAMQQSMAEGGDDFQPPAKVVPARELAAYTGTYNSPTMGQVRMAINADGQLAFEIGPKKLPVVLQHWSADVFVATNPIAAFEPNPRIERRYLKFLTDVQNEKVVGFDWRDEVDGSGQPSFLRVEGEGG